MKVLHLLVSGKFGGIESLMRDYSRYSKEENIFLFAWEAGLNAEIIERNGSNVIVLDAGRKNVFTNLRRIFRIIKDENVDVVMSHNAAPLFKIVLILTKNFFPHKRTVAYAHANAVSICDGTYKKRLNLKKIVHKMAFNCSDATVAISESVKKSLITYLHVKEKKIHVIYNGVDIEKFHSEKRIENSIPELIYVGRLNEEKGVQNTLNALAQVAPNLIYHMRIVGDGPYRGTLEKLVEKLNLGDKVEFCGNRSDIPSLLKKSDVFIHIPQCEEGFGITVVEAMAAGTICVCGKSGAIPEIICNDYNGYLVERDRQEQLTTILSELIINYQNAKNKLIKENACESAQKYSIDVFTRSLDNLVDSLLID